MIKSFSLKLGDRLVRHVCPPRWRLSLALRLHMMRDDCESELRHLDEIPTGHDTAIDIGANQGLYSVRMAGLYDRVIAFEINDEMTKDLVSSRHKNIDVVHTGLSSSHGAATLYIPVLPGGTRLLGWASLSPGSCPDANRHETKPVTISTLDSFGISAVSLIKIDVEGHEVEVLRGAAKTLMESRPTVIVEAKGDNRQLVSELLLKLGYQQVSLSSLAGAKGSNDNMIFCALANE